jgi:hypothetical protein
MLIKIAGSKRRIVAPVERVFGNLLERADEAPQLVQNRRSYLFRMA